MLIGKRVNVSPKWQCLGVTLMISAGLVGCGGGSSGNTVANEDKEIMANIPIEEKKPTSRAVADVQAPDGFNFSNYQAYAIVFTDFETGTLEAGQNYILKISDFEGGVFHLASVTHDQLAQVTVSVPRAISTLLVQLFDVADGELVLFKGITL